MKSQFYLLLIMLFAFVSESQAQKRNNNNPFYVQAGIGLDIYNHHKQVGFNSVSNAKFAYLEVGSERGIFKAGLFYTLGQKHQFYTYELEEDLQGLYVKLNLGPFIQFLPYGIDPYVFGSAAMKHTYFKQAVINPEGITEMQKITNMSFNNSFGTGIDIGRKIFVLGFQYAYSPGKATFLRPEGDPLTLFTSKHSFSVSLGIRIRPSLGGSGLRCPRFGKRSKGNTSF